MTTSSTRLLCGLVSVIFALALGACSDGPEPPVNLDSNVDQPDAGPDAPNDTGSDADADAGEECDPVEVCHDYCYHKYTRCLGENCGSTGPLEPDYDTAELDFCVEGMEAEDEDGNPETFVEGCVDEASESHEACLEFRDDIDKYADQPCDGQQQQYRQCHELLLFMTRLGDEVHASCGCTPASTAESCTDDEECDEYGDGLCLTGDDDNICTAECHDFDDDPPGPLLPDPSCAEDNGICLHLNETYADGADRISSMCNRYCTRLSDCPDGASCAPVFQLDDDEALGLCTRGVVWDINFELCGDGQDCPPGTDCYEGTCQPACEEDAVSCDFGGCGPDGYCEVNFADLF